MDDARVARCGREIEALVAETLDAFGVDEDVCAALMQHVAARVAAELAAGRSPSAPAPACQAGCATCCTLNVRTLPVEGAAAAAFLRASLGGEAARRRASALLAFHERVRWLEDEERLRARLACPFLDGRGECAIHPVRPLACRSVSSLDADECRLALAERADEESAGLVRMDLLQRDLHDAAFAAVAAALGRRGLDARSRDVSGMIGVFLADPAQAAAFGAGARVPLE